MDKEKCQLHLREDQLEAVFGNMIEAVFVLESPAWKIVYANKSMCAMYDYSPSEIMQKTIQDLSFDEPCGFHAGIAEKLSLAAQDSPLLFDCKARKKDRTFFWVEISMQKSAGVGDDRIIALARNVTERKRVEEDLRREKALVRCIIDSASDLIFIKDRGSVYLGCNKASEKFVGLLESEQIGKSDFDFFDREQAELIRRNDLEVIEGGKTFRAEEWAVFPDGSRKLFDTQKVPIFGPDGEIKGLVGICRDITERKRMEVELRHAHDELENRVAERTEQMEKTAQALRTSEERYAVAVQGSNDGIWDLNLATGEIYFSKRCKTMLGYEDEEMPNNVDEWKKRIHPVDRKMVNETQKAYLDGQIPTFEIEYRLQHKDGSYRHVLTRGACMSDSHGVPYRFSGSHTDITEKKLAEEALRKNEELLRGILDNLPVGVVLYDKEWTKILENKARRNIWGLENVLDENPEHFKGWHVDSGEMVRKEEWPAFRACKEGISTSKIIAIEGFDGRRKTAKLSGTPLRIGKIGDQLIAGIGVIEDITDQRKLEHQLLQSQKMESIGMLAGGVAHDFNNLLTVITGYGQMLLESVPEDDEEVHESINNILDAAERAVDLTRGLLAFSRKQVISPKSVQIDALISDTGKLIERIIGEDIEFRTDFSGKNLLVKADAGQIEQVLMNLATNARDAMPHGGLLSITTTEVEVREGSEARYDLTVPGKYVLITVADTGTGIDKKSLEAIFEPFYTTKEVGKGTGLGLSIVYGIIKQHNGSILAVSDTGKGTIFNIYLPLLDGREFKEEPKQFVAPIGGNETLLLAEDEESVKTFMKKILERAGYKVVVADNGEDAVARFRENEDISLVLSDVIMPRKNGKEMLDEIRRIKPGIKAVFISGYAAVITNKKSMLEEGTEFISKPFKENDLLKKVREVLDKD
jgi:two-component system cell cycle sensor histidine kinase/response regulator CckA